MGNSFVHWGEYMCAVISYCVVLFLLCDLGQRFRKNIHGNYSVSYEQPNTNNQKRYSCYTDWEGYDETLPQTTQPKVKVKPTKWLGTNTTQKEINNIKAKIKICTNPIEFCEEVDTQYNSKKSSKTTNSNNHKCDIPKENKMAHQKAQNMQQNAPQEVIMVFNDREVSEKRKCLYDAILGVLEGMKMRKDKQYAMLQSFAHIDMPEGGIFFYIDSMVLEKAKIAIDESLMNSIKSAIRETLHSPNLVIEFKEKRNVTLLNYFLNK
jgi:hypothetical protein